MPPPPNSSCLLSLCMRVSIFFLWIVSLLFFCCEECSVVAINVSVVLSTGSSSEKGFNVEVSMLMKDSVALIVGVCVLLDDSVGLIVEASVLLDGSVNIISNVEIEVVKLNIKSAGISPLTAILSLRCLLFLLSNSFTLLNFFIRRLRWRQSFLRLFLIFLRLPCLLKNRFRFLRRRNLCFLPLSSPCSETEINVNI